MSFEAADVDHRHLTRACAPGPALSCLVLIGRSLRMPAAHRPVVRATQPAGHPPEAVRKLGEAASTRCAAPLLPHYPALPLTTAAQAVA